MRLALTAALFLVACNQPAPAPTKPAGGAGDGSSVMAAPIDAAAPSQGETLAAIQKAMNELDEGAQACWALAATDQYDVAGDLVMRVDVGPMRSTAAVVRDNVHAVKLVSCMSQLLGAYRYAPPLVGQTIQLPFQFQRVDGQSVIDRRLVDAHGQDKIAVSVLLDEANTGNPAASMFEISIQKSGSTGLRVAERAEVWYFLTPARVTFAPAYQSDRSAVGSTETATSVSAGSVLYVAKGAVRGIDASSDVRAVIVVAPGGREGAARAGALPTPEFHATGGPPPGARALTGTQYGPAQIFLDASIVKDTPMAASILTLAGGAKVPEHVHANETEMLYVLEGSGMMTIAGQALAVAPTSVIQIPPNTKHAFEASTAVKALQIYTPPGPEQRFKAASRKKP